MMAYTTYTAAAQFREARKPRRWGPADTGLAESAARSQRADDRKRRVAGLVSLPTAAR